jgi:hypothetical protein
MGERWLAASALAAVLLLLAAALALITAGVREKFADSLAPLGEGVSSHKCGVALGQGGDELFMFDGVDDGFELDRARHNTCAVKPVSHSDGFVRPDLSDCNERNAVLFDPQIVSSVSPTTLAGYARCGVTFRDNLGLGGKALLQAYQERLRQHAVRRAGSYLSLSASTDRLQQATEGDRSARDRELSRLQDALGRHDTERALTQEQEAALRDRRAQLGVIAEFNSRLDAQEADAVTERGRIRGHTIGLVADEEAATAQLASARGSLEEMMTEARGIAAQIAGSERRGRELSRLAGRERARKGSATAAYDKLVDPFRRAQPRNCPSAREKYQRAYGEHLYGDPWAHFQERSSAGDSSFEWPQCDPVWEPEYQTVPEGPERPVSEQGLLRTLQQQYSQMGSTELMRPEPEPEEDAPEPPPLPPWSERAKPPPPPPPPSPPPRIVRIKLGWNSEYCLADEDGGTQVRARMCDGNADNQKWHIRDHGDGSFEFRQPDGRCLKVTGLNDGAGRIGAQHGGPCTVQSANVTELKIGDLCFDSKGGLNPGRDIITYSCNGRPNQKFYIDG